ncbi:glycosyl hydrolase [Dactylonectria estremocensis]|uniref:Glycosyl hydrolase n=1 Tax=Dactylonectria estremocensis TaxID=1079267 RepID=A0A9P9ITP1_9HYPO|nr:glycosyl hydrolase [Dactylonectria estremocensis]
MLVNNPIISGFAPDPSITRIGDTFFLVNSSFHLFPGIPIYASTDLANWKHIGNGINRPSQLSLAKSRTHIHRGGETILVGTGGLWAPTIRHHEGITYIICTNVIHPKGDGDEGSPKWPNFENFIIHTTDVWSGNWSDPVFYEFNGIDPDLFFDDDDRTYVTGSSWDTNPGTINGFEIDLNTGSKLSQEVVVWEGVIRHIPEGPHLYKKNGWYLLLIAEGGTHKNHQMSIARSKSPLGPYGSCERNPILKPTANLRTDVVYTGHGDLFQDLHGKWWFTCLGVRQNKHGQSIMGRETFLTPVEWADGDHGDCWPLIEQPIGLKVSLPMPSSLPPPLPAGNLKVPLRAEWVFIRNPDMDSYRFSADQPMHDLSLKSSSAGLRGDGTHPITFVGKRQRELCGEARAVLSLPALRGSSTVSGLAYYKDEHRHAIIAYDSAACAVVFEVLNRGKREPVLRHEKICIVGQTESLGAQGIEFRLVHTEERLDFSYQSEHPWTAAGTIDTLIMTDHDFTGPCIGLFASTGAEPTNAASANFRWCEFTGVSLPSSQ